MLNQDEANEVKKIEETYYMFPILQKLNCYIESHSLGKSFDYLHPILLESKDDVEKLLDERVRNGDIKDKSQARKSIVGSAFSLLIKYIFLKNKEQGFIAANIFITSNPKKHALIEEMVTIYVGEDTQKPDMDIAIYSVINEALHKCFILSLKTSLRERAGQTYKWKLLLEIATSDCSIKDKYNIRYKNKTMPLVGFATVNFYNEINNPQHRGMFQFFDRAFIGKPIESDFIDNLSQLPHFVNTNLL
jgi:type II restriction enzyme